MLNEMKIANEVNVVLGLCGPKEPTPDQEKELIATVGALVCSTLQAIHSIARSLEDQTRIMTITAKNAQQSHMYGEV